MHYEMYIFISVIDVNILSYEVDQTYKNLT
jgi:hypothetical protein